MKKLVVIADLAEDSLTCAEVELAIEGFLKEERKPDIIFVSSTPSTIHTSFLLNQLVLVEERFSRPLETVIFQNTDPRLFAKNNLQRAKGAEPLIIRLKSGLYICGPNAGYDFSLIKNKIDEVFQYKGLNEEGQFHTRDLYSRICAHLIDEMEDELDLEETSTNLIPDLRGFYIGHIDNFGNIKTTIRKEDFKGKIERNDQVEIKINGVVNKARYVDNLFGGSVGELVIYPGSSGEMDNRFLEITAWQHFGTESSKTGRHFFPGCLPGMEIFVKT
ncbi:SAM-dependent chlorinase/fluorinase [Patescibacteria group bacterium]|nr:SAM-dependent chlorinase/fluorinase [Patescibacteria group bacterium]